MTRARRRSRRPTASDRLIHLHGAIASATAHSRPSPALNDESPRKNRARCAPTMTQVTPGRVGDFLGEAEAARAPPDALLEDWIDSMPLPRASASRTSAPWSALAALPASWIACHAQQAYEPQVRRRVPGPAMPSSNRKRRCRVRGSAPAPTRRTWWCQPRDGAGRSGGTMFERGAADADGRGMDDRAQQDAVVERLEHRRRTARPQAARSRLRPLQRWQPAFDVPRVVCAGLRDGPW